MYHIFLTFGLTWVDLLLLLLFFWKILLERNHQIFQGYQTIFEYVWHKVLNLLKQTLFVKCYFNQVQAPHDLMILKHLDLNCLVMLLPIPILMLLVRLILLDIGQLLQNMLIESTPMVPLGIILDQLALVILGMIEMDQFNYFSLLLLYLVQEIKWKVMPFFLL